MKKRGSIKIIVLILISIFLINLVNAALTPEQEGLIASLLDNPIVKILAGDPAESLSSFAGAPLGKTGAVIIHIMVWLILFVAFSDIFGSFMPFTNKFVPWVIGFGMAVIVANFGTIPTIIGWMAAITAGLGAASVFVSMGIAFVFFAIATFFGNKLKVTILKQKIEITGKVGAEKTAAGIEGMAKAYGAFKKAAKE